MRYVSFLAAAGLLLAAQAAWALGFGGSISATRIGQPLNFAATVKLADDETLARECVGADVYSGGNKLQPGQVLVTLENAGHPGERSVRVTTYALIDEPVVTVNVTVGCAMKLSRSFVALIDPPLAGMTQAAVDASRLPEQHVDSQVAPLVDIVQGVAPAPRRAHAAAPPGPKVAARAAAPRGTHVARAAAAPTIRKRAAAPVKTGPRLELEPSTFAAAAARPADDAASATRLALADVRTAQASAAEAQAHDHEQLEKLEKQLAALRGDAQTMQQTLASLESRLRDADAQRYANPLLYALALVTALLAVLVAVLWWRQSRRPQARWWAAPESIAAGLPAATPARRSEPPEAPIERTDAHVGPAWPQPAPALVTALPMAAEPRTLPADVRSLSVEELIDLEQQAEFFVVLGQDAAAIDLLMGHVRSNEGTGPLPYLKLLEIYRRRGEADAYERIRERYNRRYAAQAPRWDDSAGDRRGLEDHATMLARLQVVWHEPAAAMALFEAMLFRRDPDEEALDLASYTQLLFLYAIARDLRGDAVESDVDVFLPLDAEPPTERTTPRPAPIDIDVSAPVRLPVRPLAMEVEELDSKSPAFIEFVESAPLRSTGF
ncbi:MAG: hypothetical protein JSR59_03660 [Proteobacteria bacterium]|nr:hypothetical protein [Pseudomonadota bacterium]